MPERKTKSNSIRLVLEGASFEVNVGQGLFENDEEAYVAFQSNGHDPVFFDKREIKEIVEWFKERLSPQ